MQKNLKQRIATGSFVMLLTVVAITLIGHYYLVTALALLTVYAAAEWSRLMGVSMLAQVAFTVAIGLGIIVLTTALAIVPVSVPLGEGGIPLPMILSSFMLKTGCLFWLFMLCIVPLLQVNPAGGFTAVLPGRLGPLLNPTLDRFCRFFFSPLGMGLVGLLALLPALAAAFHLKMIAMPVDVMQLYTMNPMAPGGLLLLWVVLQVAAIDVAAYFTGRAFGGRKLAPAISPAKTWAGAWGGLGASVVFTVICIVVLYAYGDYEVESHKVLLLLCMGPLLAAAAVVGDLLESLLKRRAGVKDSGKSLPGHGGLLDRLDGHLAALPPAALLLSYVGEGLWL